MSRAFVRAVAALGAVTHRFGDDAAHAAKRAALQRVAALRPTPGPALVAYHDALLFLAAHPSDAALLRLVQREFVRIASFLRQLRRSSARQKALENTGLPWTDTVTRFSHDGLRLLLQHPLLRVAIDGWREPRLDLSAVLNLTLPSLERGLTTAALSNEELLDALGLPEAERLAFIVYELARLDGSPLVKDQLFDSLELFVRLAPRSRAFSKPWNRLPMPGRPPHHTRDLLRRFDAQLLMNLALPAPRALDEAARRGVMRAVRDTLTLTARETDPATYLDPRALAVHDLEHGLAAATYGMTPDRQLPLESYVGFTLFKNGLAVAYGGSWLLGPRAHFGMNIFEPYRGGESGFMMCQVLRVYRQAFGIRRFEVDAQQFGLDNPDGIASGAYWFYWRHGFRSTDAKLARLAERERACMAADPAHRSSEATLIAFTRSGVALDFGGPRVPTLAELSDAVTQMIARRFSGRRAAAEAGCLLGFTTRLREAGIRLRARSADEQRVLVEVALLAEALAVTDHKRLALLARMVRAKQAELGGYQQLMRCFLDISSG